MPPSAARRAMQDFRFEVLQAGELGVVRDSPVQGTSAHARACTCARACHRLIWRLGLASPADARRGKNMVVGASLALFVF